MSPNFKGVSPLFSLVNALATTSNGVKSKFMLFICMGTGVGLVYHESTFYQFDPHARDLNGMPSERGTCVLGIFNNMKEICSFLRRLATSLCTLALTDIQFDLHSIDMWLINRNRCKKCSAHSICICNVLYCSDDLSKKRKSVKETFNQVKRHTGLPSSIPLQEPEENVNKNTSQSPIEYLSRRKRNCEAQCLKLTHGEYDNQIEALIDSNLESVTDTTPEDMNIEFEEISTDFIENKLNKLYTNFQSRNKDGTMYVCCSWMQTFFRHSVCIVDNVKIKNQHFDSICLTYLKSMDNKEWVCKTCLLAVQQDKIPTCSLAYDIKFPPIPEELKLTHLEGRLISPRLAFMQLQELPRGGQLNLKGNIVNVPADVNTTVKLLTRMLDNTETIPVKLKRKLSYKHFVAFEKIRFLRLQDCLVITVH